MKLNNPLLSVSSFDRPNLYIRVFEKTESMINNFKQFDFFEKSSQPSIVYCQTRKLTESVSEFLNQNGVKSCFYHAGLTPEDRKYTYDAFMNNEITCVVGTVAFGMGINKGDVRYVVHYGAPKSIESYYQEIGTELYRKVKWGKN